MRVVWVEMVNFVIENNSKRECLNPVIVGGKNQPSPLLIARLIIPPFLS